MGVSTVHRASPGSWGVSHRVPGCWGGRGGASPLEAMGGLEVYVQGTGIHAGESRRVTRLHRWVTAPCGCLGRAAGVGGRDLGDGLPGSALGTSSGTTWPPIPEPRLRSTPTETPSLLPPSHLRCHHEPPGPPMLGVEPRPTGEAEAQVARSLRAHPGPPLSDQHVLGPPSPY